MELQLVSIETAKLSKIVKFDWKTRAYFIEFSDGHIGDYFSNDLINHNDENYNDNKNYRELISQPTQELLRKWLRDVHQIHVYNQCNFYNRNILLGYIPCLDIFNKDNKHIESRDEDWFSKLGDYKNKLVLTFEEATEISLKRALEILKEKLNNGNKTK